MSSADHWVITREATDPIAGRISIGSPRGMRAEEAGYVVYRGETAECIKLLEIALAKFKQKYAEQGE